MKKTITDRTVDPDILSYTVGDDPVLDLALAKWDCMGTAAHVTMLSEMKGLKRPIVTKAEAARVRRELGRIVKLAEAGGFRIRVDDQDVHMAVERMLTEKLGDLGKKIHTGRSRNDQVAVDVRLHMKDSTLRAESEVVALASSLVAFGGKAGPVPLVGRTHLQPAMPSTVEMWATGHAEMVLDQLENLEAAYRLADAKCPILSMEYEEITLEKVFLELTGEGGRRDEPTAADTDESLSAEERFAEKALRAAREREQADEKPAEEPTPEPAPEKKPAPEPEPEPKKPAKSKGSKSDDDYTPLFGGDN